MFQKYRVYLYPALLVLAGVLLALFLNSRYVWVEFQVYPRSAQSLDLTGQEVSAAHFDKLRKKLPDCQILWDVPLSAGKWSSSAEAITLASLTEEDVPYIGYFSNLERIDAQACRDYGPLLEVLKAFPHVKVDYTVVLGEASFDPDAREIEVKNVPESQLSRLGCLPELEQVVCAGGTAADALMRYCHDAQISFCIRVGDQIVKENSTLVQAGDAAQEQLALLRLLPKLKRVHLTNPQAAASWLLNLQQELTGVTMNWELDVCGVVCTTEEEELNLSEAEVDLDELRQKLAYFPEAKTVYLGSCGMDNEVLAAFREELRSTIKVVWQVSLGKKLTARTDDTSFMPVREHVYYFNDEEAYNLRYCEDMVAVDIGHMSIHNIDFVEYMPNLTYLILAHTQLQYIEPISTCKNLKFLELDWSPVRDLSPLVGCTALEDLNLGMTYANFDPITEMTWLKNLWVIDCNAGVSYKMSQALPDTKVQGSGSATVASGWRNLPNYYAMRDELGMYYMSWG